MLLLLRNDGYFSYFLFLSFISLAFSLMKSRTCHVPLASNNNFHCSSFIHSLHASVPVRPLGWIDLGQSLHTTLVHRGATKHRGKEREIERFFLSVILFYMEEGDEDKKMRVRCKSYIPANDSSHELVLDLSHPLVPKLT